jgi:hypothetical protein
VAGASPWESGRDHEQAAVRAAELIRAKAAAARAKTARALSALPSDTWVALHDVRWPGHQETRRAGAIYARVDHLVVGPPGVFVIDSDDSAGRVTVVGGALLQDAQRRAREVADVEEAVLDVVRLTTTVGYPPVHPVLCFVRDEEITGQVGEVLICSAANIAELLASRPPRLTAAEVERVAAHLDAQLIVGAIGVPAEEPAAPVAKRARSGRMYAGIGVAVALILLAALLVACGTLPALGSPAAGY